MDEKPFMIACSPRTRHATEAIMDLMPVTAIPAECWPELRPEDEQALTFGG